MLATLSMVDFPDLSPAFAFAGLPVVPAAAGVLGGISLIMMGWGAGASVDMVALVRNSSCILRSATEGIQTRQYIGYSEKLVCPLGRLRQQQEHVLYRSSP